ncbi:MAG: AlpA family phage regulatory protein [Deltaproteobacteria bacterium]|nr:MAG: AlpA family phage regulatory protein [Deltaproteobacteria bacterium]
MHLERCRQVAFLTSTRRHWIATTTPFPTKRSLGPRTVVWVPSTRQVC